ncbi:serine carboxypeptidase-like 47 isoform X3 [Tripterygium wilfordii]|uniref:serine carboxypeptidase-like 47 isoform X3 n=1 Tax=Tripterygium wilfordii TaxID=458696 RepID=UPI0018F82884|nr:serine carboxypeptidase-like 47 isoform X3 [Tripterygium wilfordii]
MALASQFSHIFPFLFLFHLFLTTQELQRLELFSEADINITNNAHPRLVQKRLRLPFAVDSGPPVEERGHYAGYYHLPHTRGARMFYFFFESRTNKNDPVVIWLAGGPGCGGEIALFYENGPFHFAKNLSLVWNKYGWDKVSNLLYVDQPIGTGFSYTTNDSDLRKNQNDVTNDLYDFLQDFFTEYREFDKHDFFITGESYAGHYAPALASKILQENKDKRRIYIHLKYYDIRKDCEGRLCYDFSNMEKLMNDESIKKSLGVGADIHFVSCNSTVSDNMKGDFMKNYQVGIPALLENGIKILIYAGDKDVLCNWQGNLKWVLGMKWYGDKIFKALRPVDFFVDGDKVGELRTHKHLSFVKINKAGHLVPMDQPKAALQMIETWMQDRLSVSKHVFFSSS